MSTVDRMLYATSSGQPLLDWRRLSSYSYDNLGRVTDVYGYIQDRIIVDLRVDDYATEQYAIDVGGGGDLPPIDNLHSGWIS